MVVHSIRLSIRRLILPLSLLGLCFAQDGLAKETPGLSAEQLLQKADRARGGLSEGLKWQIRLEFSGTAPQSEYEVQVKGVNVIARCTAPARQKGETMLFNDRNLWIHKPGLKKPVSLSPRQRLNGQAANGDIATTNYARDYEGKVEGQEMLNGKKVFRLFLQAKEKNVTYDKIRYWITEGDFLGVKAEFLTLEGKPFKLATFEYKNSILVNGVTAPFVSKMDIQDANQASERTAIVYSAPKSEKLSDSLFNVNNLAR